MLCAFWICLTLFGTYSEWLTHQHRDSLSSIVGHPALTSYVAIADGEAIGRVKFEMTEVSETRSGRISGNSGDINSECSNRVGLRWVRTRIDGDRNMTDL